MQLTAGTHISVSCDQSFSIRTVYSFSTTSNLLTTSFTNLAIAQFEYDIRSGKHEGDGVGEDDG